MSKRASIFEGGDELDLSGFQPKSGTDDTAPAPEKVREVSEAANFPSRAPAKPKPAPAAAAPAAIRPKRASRQHRTGRNVQFNVKASQATVDAFYEISDAQGWVLGETLEKALAALRRDLAG